jgi:hypothetical protein
VRHSVTPQSEVKGLQKSPDRLLDPLAGAAAMAKWATFQGSLAI